MYFNTELWTLGNDPQTETHTHITQHITNTNETTANHVWGETKRNNLDHQLHTAQNYTRTPLDSHNTLANTSPKNLHKNWEEDSTYQPSYHHENLNKKWQETQHIIQIQDHQNPHKNWQEDLTHWPMFTHQSLHILLVIPSLTVMVPGL